MMFHAMLSTLVRQLSLPQECLHEEGLDLQAGPFSLHIRERDQLVTLFIPLGDIQTPSLAAMADWPGLCCNSAEAANRAPCSGVASGWTSWMWIS